MTFSVVTFEHETGTYAGAAATGNLCVGGWVLRGDIEAGLVASQGTSPSTFWRDDVLRRMNQGLGAEEAVAEAVSPDEGRDYRQIIALDRRGGTFGFTGAKSIPFAGHHCEPGLAIGGNMLTSEAVVDAMLVAARLDYGSPIERLLAVLEAAERSGGDMRGLESSALLVLSPAHPPIDLRIDYAERPVQALKDLCATALQPDYRMWLGGIPVLQDKSRAPS